MEERYAVKTNPIKNGVVGSQLGSREKDWDDGLSLYATVSNKHDNVQLTKYFYCYSLLLFQEVQG